MLRSATRTLISVLSAAGAITGVTSVVVLLSGATLVAMVLGAFAVAFGAVGLALNTTVGKAGGQ